MKKRIIRCVGVVAELVHEVGGPGWVEVGGPGWGEADGEVADGEVADGLRWAGGEARHTPLAA